MLCREPFVKAGAAHPCGRCLPCLVNRRRTWTHRIMLESLLHRANCFVTLTYSDENLEVMENGKATLVPKHFQDWLKRFRFAINPVRIRYYGVGEYGDATGRPHYHAAIFGYPACEYICTRVSVGWKDCCRVCNQIGSSWGLGNVYVGSLETKSAQYVSGYVTKKMTHRQDARLDGRYPEFARMSTRPGIAADAMHEIASVLMQFDVLETQGDVPSSLRHGARLMPLGRYLRRRLRVLCGHDAKAPEATVNRLKAEVSSLYEASRGLPTSEARDVAFRNALVDVDTQRVMNMLGRMEIFKQRKLI